MRIEYIGRITPPASKQNNRERRNTKENKLKMYRFACFFQVFTLFLCSILHFFLQVENIMDQRETDSRVERAGSKEINALDGGNLYSQNCVESIQNKFMFSQNIIYVVALIFVSDVCFEVVPYQIFCATHFVH